MGFADTLRKELKSENAAIIAKEFEPRKNEIMATIAEGIKRPGYVEIDTCGFSATAEGMQLGVNRGNIEAFYDFVRAEGFKVKRCWWGHSSDGAPDILKIYL